MTVVLILNYYQRQMKLVKRDIPKFLQIYKYIYMFMYASKYVVIKFMYKKKYNK